MKVLYLTPDLFDAHGGIARYSRLALKALSESATVERVDTIVLMDRSAAPDPHYVTEARTNYSVCGGDRRTFGARVLRALACGGYDVVLAAHVNLAPFMFLTAPIRRRPRTVTVMHGIDVWTPLRLDRRIALQRSDLLLSVSAFTARAATRSNKLDPAKIALVPNCLDPLFAAPLETPQCNAQPSLLTVSRLVRSESSKGHDLVLRALPVVLATIGDLRYDIVGDGDLRPDLEDLATGLGVRQHVRFLGAIADEDLRALYRDCTAFVMPSKWEGFGLVFLEAMAYGRPIVASTLDAAPEVLGETALLVDPRVPGALADALRSLLASPDLQERLGAAGRARLLQHFTFDHFKNALLHQLDRLTDQHHLVAARCHA